MYLLIQVYRFNVPKTRTVTNITKYQKRYRATSLMGCPNCFFPFWNTVINIINSILSDLKKKKKKKKKK